MRFSIILLVLLLFPACSRREAPPADPKIREELKSYVMEHHIIPEKYVLDKFDDHDVIFLGETHYVRHDPLFVQKLIPLVYEKGVRYLCTEFARRVDQPLVDSLLKGRTYDEQLARHIAFLQFVHWGYQEYLDIFRSAWQLNRNLPRRSRPFRILGMNNSPNWVFVRSEADRDNPEVMKKVWHGEDESDWAEVILDSVVSKGNKALVYCGAHHALTEYRQPIVVQGKFLRFGDMRAGNYVFQKIGKRAITIFLHAPWFSSDGYDRPMVRAADGYIDAVIDELEPQYRRFGVDTKGTPFGTLPGESSIYKYGYSNFNLGTIFDGYICQGPLSSYVGVTAIKDFVNDSNIGDAHAQSPVPKFRKATAEEFYQDAVATADVQSKMPGR